MKKAIIIILSAALFAALVTGCKKQVPPKPVTPHGDHHQWPVYFTDTTKA